mgnify:CR=1 FL=1
METAQAQPIAAPTCVGESCIDQNPVAYGCDLDATIEDELTVTVNRWQDAWLPQTIVVQKMYSAACQANWTRAYIPNGTYVFIQEINIVNKQRSARGMLQTNGITAYFWANSNMSSGGLTNQACVALPIFSGSSGHDLYDRHCTEFSQ